MIESPLVYAAMLFIGVLVMDIYCDLALQHVRLGNRKLHFVCGVLGILFGGFVCIFYMVKIFLYFWPV